MTLPAFHMINGLHSGLSLCIDNWRWLIRLIDYQPIVSFCDVDLPVCVCFNQLAQLNHDDKTNDGSWKLCSVHTTLKFLWLLVTLSASVVQKRLILFTLISSFCACCVSSVLPKMENLLFHLPHIFSGQVGVLNRWPCASSRLLWWPCCAVCCSQTHYSRPVSLSGCSWKCCDWVQRRFKCV